jgi:hypothetical protein
MKYMIERFTAGFGICFKRPADTVHMSRNENNRLKLGRSIPIVALVITILQMESRHRYYKQLDVKIVRSLGTRAFDLRGILYGSILGIPAGIALDLVGTVLQAIYALRNRSEPSVSSGSK